MKIGTQEVLLQYGNWYVTDTEYNYCGEPFSTAIPFWIPHDFIKDKGPIEKEEKGMIYTVQVNGFDRWMDYLENKDWFNWDAKLSLIRTMHEYQAYQRKKQTI